MIQDVFIMLKRSNRMKEYSNAFKKDYWYNKYVEIFNSGVVYYGNHEREFIKAVRDKYGLNIVASDFATYHQHFSVTAYFDFEDSNDLGKKLKEEIKKYKVIGWSLDNENYTSEIRHLGDSLAHEYLQILHYDKNYFSEVYFYAKDFKYCVNARSHSLSLPAIRSYLFHTYKKINFWRVIIWYEPSVTCIVEDEMDYKRLLKSYDSIVENCFWIIKQYDKFYILNKEDINLKILLKSDLNAKEVNMYAREIL